MTRDGAQGIATEPITSDCGERLTTAMRAAAQDERRRLARDLHDSVSQTLISLHLSAQAAADLWDTQPAQARAALDLVRQLARGATAEMRALLVELREAVLERDGLTAALGAYGAVVQQYSGLHVEIDVADGAARAGPPGAGARLPLGHEAPLYYLAREALTNVVKHARASRATVSVRVVPDTMVRLVVEDDGIGFGGGAPAAAFSYGLVGMRERVAALGGRLHLENRPGGGARVVAELPVNAAAAGVSVA